MKSIIIALLGAFALVCAIPAYGYKGLTVAKKKEQDKAKTRWSIADSFDQKNKIRLWDLWLALHTASPFEFYIGGAYLVGSYGSGDRFSASNVILGGYVTIFGLEAQLELGQSDPRALGLFNLRIFGNHAQSTNITLQGGARFTNRDGYTDWNLVAGLMVALYLQRYVGVEGIGRHYQPSQGGPVLTSGNRLEANAFIDFRMLRIYGGYFYDEEAQGETTTLKRGIAGGVRLFF